MQYINIRRFSIFSTRSGRATYADSHKRGLDWIPSYLGPVAQNALRAEMQKARTASDVEGYIYAFEILGTGPILSVAPLSHLIPFISSNPRETARS